MTTQMLTVTEAGKRLRISRASAYKLVSDGHLPVVRIGRRILVPEDAFDEWIDGQVDRGAPITGPIFKQS